MVVGPTSARGDRRRRVLTEERISSSAQAYSSAAGKTANRGPLGSRYAPAAAVENQVRITSLIPRRWITLAGGWLLFAVFIAVLEVAHVKMPTLRVALGARQLTAADLSFLHRGGASIAVWFCSVLLFMCSAVSLLIYSLRRHRVDDYQGRYRIWIWSALGWIVLSLNVTASLHTIFVESMIRLTGWSPWKDGAIWWIAPAIFLLVAVGIRVVIDVYECRSACVGLLTAGGCWLVAVLVHLEWIPVASSTTQTLLVAGLSMAGYLMALTGLVLYARHIIQETEDLMSRTVSGRVEGQDTNTSRNIPSRGSTAGSKPAGGSPQKSVLAGYNGDDLAVSRRTDLDTGHERTSRSGTVRDWTDGSEEVRDLYGDEENVPSKKRKLSKSERKRLRKLKERARRAA